MKPKRFNHSNCSETAFSVFAGAMMATKGIKIVSHKEPSPKCHFTRYNIKYESEKASIVYDTKAAILTFTASETFIDRLNDLYYKSVASLKSANPEQKQAVPQKTATTNRERTNKVANNNAKKKGSMQFVKKDNDSKRVTQNKNEVKAIEAESLEYKNGYSVKDFSAEKLNALIKQIRASGVRARVFHVSDKGKLTELKSYIIEDNKNQKLFLRYMPQKKVVQLQGKRSSLFGEVQVILNNNTDFISAVNSHIELTGEQKRAKEIERQLKKALPNGYDFLSEQSKIDFSIGLMDIGNDEVRLSDYSVLLVPPYRGLERLIFDLQRAKGIDVKMIGQAFERPNGVYELKVGYKRKINSVVYAEVMTALYTEYFEKRNFYAHADNSLDSVNRALTDKTMAKDIFEKLLKLIDYNCKKLNEIGFGKPTKEMK